MTSAAPESPPRKIIPLGIRCQYMNVVVVGAGHKRSVYGTGKGVWGVFSSYSRHAGGHMLLLP